MVTYQLNLYSAWWRYWICIALDDAVYSSFWFIWISRSHMKFFVPWRLWYHTESSLSIYSSWTNLLLNFLWTEISRSIWNICYNFSYFDFSLETRRQGPSSAFLRSCIILYIFTLSSATLFYFNLISFCIAAIFSYYLLKVNLIPSSLFFKSSLIFSMVSSVSLR